MTENRNRAWRRFKKYIKKGKGQGSEEKWRREKKWKMLYLRSEKIARAKKLGIEYPRKNSLQLKNQALSSDE